MRSSERTILFVLFILAVVAVFWFFVLQPKRAELSDLGDQVDAARSDIATQEAIVAAGIESKENFQTDYGTLVEMGKAVPENADTPNLLVQLTRLAERSDVDFRSINLSSASGAVGPAEEPEGDGEGDGNTTTPSAEEPIQEPGTQPATQVPATEASAATAPIGSTVGPAGLPVMPYALVYRAGFFDVADLFKQLDNMVRVRKNGNIKVNGRLLTIDGFVLAQDPRKGFPRLSVNVAVTSYLAPADQGLFAGATPEGPATATGGP